MTDEVLLDSTITNVQREKKLRLANLLLAGVEQLLTDCADKPMTFAFIGCESEALDQTEPSESVPQAQAMVFGNCTKDQVTQLLGSMLEHWGTATEKMDRILDREPEINLHSPTLTPPITQQTEFPA